MSLTRAGFAALAMLLVAPVSGWSQGYLPAADRVHERIFEISPLTGWLAIDSNLDYDGAPMYGARATINNTSWWGFEGRIALSPGQKRNIPRAMLNNYDAHLTYGPTGAVSGFILTNLESAEFVEETDTDLLAFAGNMIFHLRRDRLRPFITAGGGFIDDISNSNEDPPAPLSNGFLEFGAGLKWYRPSGWHWRVDVQDMILRKSDAPRDNPRAALVAAQVDLGSGGGSDGILFQEPYSPVDYRGKRWTHSLGVAVSVTFPFGFAWKDGDDDGIETRFDDCPTTAPGVVVDGLGCGIDSDEDGVFDGIDNCDETPTGAFVDLVGCPRDIDGDGVFDGIDIADDTPPGALVDARGQHFDTDEDGVLDGLDECNDTPLGAIINTEGCVDDPLEDRFLRGQAIVVENVRFESGGAEIDPLSYHYVNKYARLVERWTGNDERPLRVELGVFTDGIGTEEYNQSLSQRRAESIREYLLENYFGMGANNLVAVGYGESTPVADDSTVEGRRRNNRLEVRFTAEGAPPKEWDYGEDDFGDGDFEELEGAGDIGDADDTGAAAADTTVPPVPVLDAPDLTIPDVPELPDLEDDLDLLDEPEPDGP